MALFGLFGGDDEKKPEQNTSGHADPSCSTPAEKAAAKKRLEELDSVKDAVKNEGKSGAGAVGSWLFGAVTGVDIQDGVELGISGKRGVDNMKVQNETNAVRSLPDCAPSTPGHGAPKSDKGFGGLAQ